MTATDDDQNDPWAQALAVWRGRSKKPRKIGARKLNRRHVTGLETRGARPRLRARDLTSLESRDIARTVQPDRRGDVANAVDT
jgi:hypothetical protein